MSAEEANAYVREYAERWHIGGEQLTELYGLAGRLGLLMSNEVADRCAALLVKGPPPLIITCKHQRFTKLDDFAHEVVHVFDSHKGEMNMRWLEEAAREATAIEDDDGDPMDRGPF